MADGVQLGLVSAGEACAQFLQRVGEECLLRRERLVRGVLGEEAALVTELDGLVDCCVVSGSLHVFVGFVAGVKDRLPALFVNIVSFFMAMMVVSSQRGGGKYTYRGENISSKWSFP